MKVNRFIHSNEPSVIFMIIIIKTLYYLLFSILVCENDVIPGVSKIWITSG